MPLKGSGDESKEPSDEQYKAKRKRNNEAAKRSRDRRRENSTALAERFSELERTNGALGRELAMIRDRLLPMLERPPVLSPRRATRGNCDVNGIRAVPKAVPSSSGMASVVTYTMSRSDPGSISNADTLTTSSCDPITSHASPTASLLRENTTGSEKPDVVFDLLWKENQYLRLKREQLILERDALWKLLND